MKRIINFLSLVLLTIFLLSCQDEKIVDHKEEYYLYKASSTSNLFEDYFGIEDTKTKIFNSKDDFNSFNNLLNDDFISEQNKFSIDVNFSINSVAVTAIYCDNYLASISLSNIEFNDNSVEQDFNILFTESSEDTSQYAFLYVVINNEIDFTFDTNTLEYTTGDLTPIVPGHNDYVVYKPIIYFYPVEEMSLTIKFIDEDRLITTYPKYNNGWSIKLEKDGTFTLLNQNRHYYALYFDEVINYQADFTTGFYVTKDNAIDFLEEKLTILGYTEREMNEFIMYWLPILEENENSLVYFETTDIRNSECPLLLSTEPDSILRTIIHIKKIDRYTEIIEQHLPTFERTGFTMVEWGGVTYK